MLKIRTHLRFSKSFIGTIQFRSIFIQTESTPNPNSLKFLPQREVLTDKFGPGVYFQKGQFKEIVRSPLAISLFAIGGIKSVFFGKDFTTVTKEFEEVWIIIKPKVFTKLLDFYAENLPIILDNFTISDTTK